MKQKKMKISKAAIKTTLYGVLFATLSLGLVSCGSGKVLKERVKPSSVKGTFGKLSVPSAAEAAGFWAQEIEGEFRLVEIKSESKGFDATVGESGAEVEASAELKLAEAQDFADGDHKFSSTIKTTPELEKAIQQASVSLVSELALTDNGPAINSDSASQYLFSFHEYTEGQEKQGWSITDDLTWNNETHYCPLIKLLSQNPKNGVYSISNDGGKSYEARFSAQNVNNITVSCIYTFENVRIVHNLIFTKI